MRTSSILVSGAVAAVAVASSAMAGWTATYDFSDPSQFSNGYFSGGDGGGFVGRTSTATTWLGQPGVNTAFESGAMRYTQSASPLGLGGARLALNGGDEPGAFSNYRNNYWTPKMAKAENPYVSVQVFNGGSMQGSVIFYTYAVTTPSTDYGVGISGGTYRALTVTANGMVNAGGGTSDVAMAAGWNTLAMQLQSDGTLNFYLNGVNIRSVTGSGHDYLMDAWDSAAGFYSNSNNGADSHLFDNFVVGSGGGVIPGPGAVALLGVAGLAARRRRA